MKIKKIISFFIILATLLIGCASYKNNPEFKLKESFVQQYMNELFNVDKGLYQKYKFEPPLPRYQDTEPPTIFVDQRYFKENKELRKFIDEKSLLIIGPDKPLFSIPLGMELIKNPPNSLSTADNSVVIGEVVAIKKIKDIYIDDKWYGDTYRTKVDAIVKLDNGNEVRVKYGFVVELTILNDSTQKYKIKSAEFNTSPWVAKIDGKWHLQTMRPKK